MNRVKMIASVSRLKKYFTKKDMEYFSALKKFSIYILSNVYEKELVDWDKEWVTVINKMIEEYNYEKE